MFLVLIFAAFIALLAVAAFVLTVVRTAVRQVLDNRRREHRTEAPVAWFTSVDQDAPVNYWPTYTDARAVDGSHTPAGYAPDGLGAPDNEDVPEHREAGQEFWPTNDLRRRCY